MIPGNNSIANVHSPNAVTLVSQDSLGNWMVVPVGSNGGLVLANDVLGDEYSFNAVAPARAAGSNPTFTSYALKSVQGFKTFEIVPPKLPTDEFLVVSWSILADDETALGLILDAYCDEIESGVATLKAGVISTNVDKCILAGDVMAHNYDGTTTIKTILSTVCKLGSTTPTGNVFYSARVVM